MASSCWQAAHGRGDFGQVHQRNELSQVGEAVVILNGRFRAPNGRGLMMLVFPKQVGTVMYCDNGPIDETYTIW